MRINELAIAVISHHLSAKVTSIEVSGVPLVAFLWGQGGHVPEFPLAPRLVPSLVGPHFSGKILHVKYLCCQNLIRPSDLLVDGFRLSAIQSSIYLSSELAERNSTKTGHMLGSKCDLKTYVRNLG